MTLSNGLHQASSSYISPVTEEKLYGVGERPRFHAGYIYTLSTHVFRCNICHMAVQIHERHRLLQLPLYYYCHCYVSIGATSDDRARLWTDKAHPFTHGLFLGSGGGNLTLLC